jgi:replicative DNA helicase
MTLNLDNFESIFCYKMLTDKNYFSRINPFFELDYVHDKDRKNIISLVQKIFSEKNIFPNLTEVKNYINSKELSESFVKILNDFKILDKSFNDTELYNCTERFLKERGIYKAMISVVDDIQSGNIDSSKILDSFEKRCKINLDNKGGFNITKDYDLLVESLKLKESFLKSKFNWLDNIMDGGFRAEGKALYLVVGQVNVGKSIVLGNLAKNIVENGKNVLLISLEMSEMMYASRITSGMIKIPIYKLKEKADEIAEAMEIYKTRSNIGQLMIKEFPPSKITPSQLEAYIKSVNDSGFKVDAVVIDYLNLLHGEVGNNSYERLKYVTEQVRALSYVFACPFITATQINRGGFDEDNGPELANLSESINIAATCDFIFGVYKKTGEKSLPVMRFKMLKNRWGANYGEYAFKLDTDTLTLIEDDEFNNTMCTIEDSEEEESLEDLSE